MSNTGTIVQVIGPVVDVDFSAASALPAIYDALTLEYEVNGTPTKLTLEVQQFLGENWVRSIAMSSTEGLKRGMSVTNTAAPISVPVGEGVEERGQVTVGEFDINDRADDLNNFTDVGGGSSSGNHSEFLRIIRTEVRKRSEV